MSHMIPAQNAYAAEDVHCGHDRSALTFCMVQMYMSGDGDDRILFNLLW